jgi:hypothetical protein
MNIHLVENLATNAIKNAKKYIKKFINDDEIDPVAASTPTPSPEKIIFDHNEMNIMMINHQIF